ncbi:type VI secretion system accessory protein TagJ [Vibrio sp. SCSIO 43136]|uniref:type VI secretion system accessory protein TagJ n=1 Tax=Vibrio sp. SCSIO 43136 TaxID=2819101 RepID=UPI002075DF55|nr:type VI secretion system accessory protein TagJ [Vibrio sp. SCSIO 43136]USD67514.1 protein of avirulence locus ImpE [Vibrio sp. SCSIO 43136]
MEQLKALIEQGKLSQAIEQTVMGLKSKPKDKELRSQFVELLCIDGQFERADQQLELITKQHPECLPGVINMRQLVKAAQCRQDFAQGGDCASTVGKSSVSLAPLIEMRLAILQGNSLELSQMAQQLEAQRKQVNVQIAGQDCHELRDIDDSLGGHLEVFGANGLYYIIPIANITWLKLLPVTSLFELVWRKAEIDINNGPSGEVFIPLTYISSQTDAQKLGLETDWQALLGSDIYQGQGQKMFLVNDEALTLCQWQELSAAHNEGVLA